MYTVFMHGLHGYVRIRISGEGKERFVNICRNNGIYFWSLEAGENEIRCNVTLAEFWELKTYAKKLHVRILVIERKGFPFFLYKNKKRQALFLSVFACMTFLYIMSLFLWDIQFEGNSYYSDEVLREFLENQGYHHGIKLKAIVCDQIEKSIRNAYQNITWVSARIEGTRLVVAIKENYGILEVNIPEQVPCDLVSDVDGVVETIVTRRGTPLVHIGDSVKPGDILISGAIEVLNDSKEVADVFYVESDADIYIRTEIPYSDEVLRIVSGKQYYDQWQAIYLNFFGSQMKFSAEEPMSYGEKEEILDVKQAVLFSNLYLPVYYGKILQRYYQPVELYMNQSQTETVLQDNLENFLEKLEEKGIQIVEKNVKIEMDYDVGRLSGTLTVLQRCQQTAPISYRGIEIQEQ